MGDNGPHHILCEQVTDMNCSVAATHSKNAKHSRDGNSQGCAITREAYLTNLGAIVTAPDPYSSIHATGDEVFAILCPYYPANDTLMPEEAESFSSIALGQEANASIRAGNCQKFTVR